MKIQSKIFSGYIWLSLIFIIIGIIIIFQINSLNPIASELNEHIKDFDNVITLTGLVSDIESLRFELMLAKNNFRITFDEIYQERYHTTSERINKSIDDTIKKLDNEFDQKIFEDLRETNENLENIETEIFNLVRQNKLEEADILLTDGKYFDLNDQFSNLIDRFHNNRQSESSDMFSKLVQMSVSIQRNNQIFNDLSQIILISFVGVVIASVLLSFFISRSISRPIRKLSVIASELNKGKFDTRIVIPSNDEIGEFSKAFDSVAQTLKKNHAQIKKQLDQQKDIDVKKDEFSTMISHELKTPLAPILGWCDALQDPDVLGTITPEQKKAIQTISSSAEKLERLIGDLLDIQKLELGRMVFEKVNFQVDEMMNNIKNSFEPTVKQKQIRLVNSVNEKINLKSDKRRIEEVLTNMIYNAIDFVPKKDGRIELDAKNENGAVVFSVKDNGKGISKEAQESIFRKFYQTDTSLTRKHGGTGLGLSICKGIVEALGGKIWVESKKGLGSNFYFTLPKCGDQN